MVSVPFRALRRDLLHSFAGIFGAGKDSAGEGGEGDESEKEMFHKMVSILLTISGGNGCFSSFFAARAEQPGEGGKNLDVRRIIGAPKES